MVTQIKKIFVIALCTMAIHGIVKAISQIDIQRARGLLLDKAGVKNTASADDKKIVEGIESKLKDIGQKVKEGKLVDAYKDISAAESFAQEKGMFTKWFIEPSTKALKNMMGLFVRSSYGVAGLLATQVSENLTFAFENFTKINNFMNSLVQVNLNLSDIFEGKVVSTATSALTTQIKNEINTACDAFKKALTSVNALSIQQFTKEERDKFDKKLEIAFGIYNELFEQVFLDLNTMASNPSLIGSQGNANFAFAFNYKTIICEPIVQIAEALVALKEKEAKSGIQIFTKHITIDSDKLAKMTDIIAKMNKKPWTKLDYAKWVGGTLLAAGTAYYAFKNREVISDKLGLPAAADYLKNTQLGSKIGAAVSAGTAYILDGAGKIRAYMPTSATVSEAWSTALKKLRGKKNVAATINEVEIETEKGDGAVSVLVNEVPSEVVQADAQSDGQPIGIKGPQEQEQEGISLPDELNEKSEINLQGSPL